MSVVKSGNAAHDNACALAEGQRQVAVRAASTPAAVRSAEVTFYQAIVASCRSNNNSSGIVPPLTALRELGPAQ
jgi:hypothetical protein